MEVDEKVSPKRVPPPLHPHTSTSLWPSMDLHLADDPSDFTSPLLSALDSSLRCSICREFFTAPVSLPCAHSFCSTCIRSSLDAAERDNKKCPSCGKSGVNERDLRMNTSLEEAVDRYREGRYVWLVAPYSHAHGLVVGCLRGD
jgi:hypothetical protein